MTEYGRGPGSEPWHPEDPLYGDSGWGGQQPAGGTSPYGGQGQYHPQQPHQHQQQSHQSQQQYGGEWSTGQQQAYGRQQYEGQQQYDGQQKYDGGAAYGYNGNPDQGYGGGSDQGHSNGGWDTDGQGQVPYGGDPMDPYGGQQPGYGSESHDYYSTPDAYSPPEPPGRRKAARPEADPESEADWDPGPDQGEHAFFADGEDSDDDPGSRGDRRGRGGKKPKKRRSGCACLVVTLVFAGGLGGVGYFGYQFYQDRFGTAPDYAGEGSGTAVVEIPKDSGGYVIGQKLKAAGVVKSVDAFVSAQKQNPDGQTIQSGVYTLKKEMSAKSAVALMLSPKSRSNLIIPEGKRNAWVYAQIDSRLHVPKGTTESVAKKDWRSLGLPDWANTNKDIKDPLEGFLYPSSYPVAKGQKPADVLKNMVSHATEKYDELGLKAKAAELNLKDPLQVLTVASLVQAEGKYKHDFEKVATVVYNRLKPNNTETYGLLDFDSTVNYLRGKSELATGSVDELRKLNDPYNTYKIKGLPPGPIGNPGEVALNSALHPAKGNWYYFVSVSEDKTLFAETNEEQNQNRKKYLEGQ
ncbi:MULTISPECIES: endolytic transglycosylase MltG [Streptomyces]|uniref:Endolytic murein transglycosylase n=1 Tax=Streptomyces venezuelae TaxID=54571 RepID=A0A5P2B674_STRVZ|nr:MULTISPECIES: endolytic transglycosylase MltG [Streptomyces]NDZ97885.1 endolytic transglycosylase MltG [Streptomyces sp. SID10116]MYY83586.1 endolytic transglycosylase MltG [Streptomyces sp. SID335]MYZ13472.1 endolytic transglycosylase MltG [Streptomyces sp. SID337]NDZ85012.1 endolytic transglycosylase MltG [Streptomyces sp. SID10115]NEB43954.1 endolytic transglycosylase MltG [Streptomyces sp. SID339]